MSPTTAEHVRAGLGDKVAYVLDGGPAPVGLESSILDCRGEPVLLRPGGLSREEIERTIGKTLAAARETEVLSPGQLPSHYAPHARLRLDADRPRNGEAYLGFGPPPERPRMRNLSAAGNLTEAASNLFRMLHELDAMQPETIAVAPIPREGLGEAINDRLKRAAAPRR
jgi:L-threonylcarbamoyladenylate synthase